MQIPVGMFGYEKCKQYPLVLAQAGWEPSLTDTAVASLQGCSAIVKFETFRERFVAFMQGVLKTCDW